MKPIINLKKGSCMLWSPFNLVNKSLVISALILVVLHAPLQAQEDQYTRPSWWFGVAAGGNFNFYQGSTHQLNALFTPPATFHDGQGVGLFLAPLLEYHRPGTMLGFMLQGGYDGRNGKFDQVKTACNCPSDLSTDLSYISVEPSLRLAPFKSNFYLFAGPRFAFNQAKSFTYKQGVNPDIVGQTAPVDVTGDFSDINKTQISGQIGAGIDIMLSSKKRHTQFALSPFVSFHPYFGQTPRSVETWNITTIRGGAALKFGVGHKIEVPKKEEVLPPVVVAVVEPEVKFTVAAPKNPPTVRMIHETFPIRNYVFFDLGSTEIPGRYVLLKKEQAQDFREYKLVSNPPRNLSGRSERQMVVYYNILNILGERMVNNPTTNIRLVGSSEQGKKDGREMAESIKEYLVSVFGIDASRITTEGRDRPAIPAVQPGGTLEIDLLREGDRRVTIESSSPVLLMEFNSNPPPQDIIVIQEAPADSYVSFDVEGEEEAFTSWSLELTDDKGVVQNYGPYTEQQVTIPTKSILGNQPEGDYKVTMIGQTKSGTTVRKESTTHVVLWMPPKDEEVMRFSVIYDFNRSKATPVYEKYLNNVVIPKIPTDGTVVITGHTDIIGGEEYNQKLSLARANDTRAILEKGLKKAGRSDVKFEVSASGEAQAPFSNKFPEERFYNRTVIIDIVPQK